MARSVSQQAADNDRRRQEARYSEAYAHGAHWANVGPQDVVETKKVGKDGVLEEGWGEVKGTQRVLTYGDRQPDGTLDSSGAHPATAQESDRAATNATKPIQDASGSGKGYGVVGTGAGGTGTGQPTPLSPNAAAAVKSGAAATTDGGGPDADQARLLRDALLQERMAQQPRPAPYVYYPGKLQGAQISEGAPQMTAARVDQTPQISAATVGPTQQISATNINAPTIAPVERVTAGTVAVTPDAQAARVASGPQDQARSRTMSLLDSLEQTAAGNGPSAAQIQMQKATDQAIATQRSQLASMNGGGSVTAQLRAADNIAGITQKAAADSALLKLQEQQQARDQLLKGYESTRGQDINVATTQAGFEQAANLKNVDMAQARALKDADLQAAADMGNANAVNELNRRQAELTLAARTSNASNTLEAAKSNQGVESTMNLENARLRQDAAKSNQGVQATADLENARMVQDAEKANQDATLKTRLAQAGFDQQAILQESAQDLQRKLANAGFELSQEQIDDLKARTLTDQALQSQGQVLNYDTGVKTAEIEQQHVDNERDKILKDYQLAKARGDNDMAMAYLNMLVGIGSKVVSDRRAKTDIKPLYSDERGKSDRKALLDDVEGKRGGDPVDELLSDLKPSTFRYKDPKADGAAPGKRYGVMAQDLEKSPMGRSIVIEMENGRKGIDTGQAVGVLLAAMSRMNQKIKAQKGARR